MQDAIEKKLAAIEEKENVKILYAAESGSRAWGFASPDSDYDVRFLYVRPRSFYLKLEKTRDVIEWQLDDVFDINGWDIQKALRLLYSSNPTLFEWARSPIVYRRAPQWEAVRQEMDRCFQKKAGLYHYLNTARRTYQEHLCRSEVSLKKYFYTLRPILAARWILNRGTPPPIVFTELVDAELDSSLRPCVERLLKDKKSAPELWTGPRIEMLNQYLMRQIEAVRLRSEALPPDPKPEWENLDELFLSLLTDFG